MKKKFLQVINFLFPTKENNFYPGIFRRNFLLYFLIFLILLKLAFFNFLFYFAKTSLFAEVSKEMLFFLLNQTRSSFNLPPLRENPSLSLAAYYKAKDMLEKNYFSHFSPEGTWLLDWLKRVNYQYQFAGENLAIGFVEAEEVHNAWMNSRSHRANILNSKYQEVGIAVLTGNFQGNKVTVVVQIFGTPKKTELSKPISHYQEQKKVSPSLPPEEEKSSIIESPKEKTLKYEETGKFVLSESISSPSLTTNFLSFFLLYFEKYLNNFLKYFSLFLLALLLISIFVEIKTQYLDLILKGIFLVFLFYLISFLNKEILFRAFSPYFLIF